MTWVYGHLPIHFSDFKDLDLTHDSVSIGTISLVSGADELEFRDAVTALDTALGAATAGDLGATWDDSTGELTIASATAKTWEIEAWAARGFFGFPEYPIDETNQSVGTSPAGAVEMAGLWLDTAEGAQVREERPDYEEGYAASDGLVVALQGLIEWAEAPLGWTTYLGHVVVDGGGAGAWTLSNPDGELDGTLVDASVRGKRKVMGESYLQVQLRVAVSV